MPTVAINAPKTPVTKGSNGVAMATLPNICKMPGPPAPFVPVPLPNIGTSDNGPKGYSTSVKIEGHPVAIQGSSFLSKGDIAAQGSGGGIVSMNVQGPTTFIGPGSLDVKIENKNVQLLGDPMLNNCGPAGAPANAATMIGVLQPAISALGGALGIIPELEVICQAKCACQAKGQGQNCISAILKAYDAALGDKSTIKPETPFDTSTIPPSPTKYPGKRRPDVVIVSNPKLPPIQSNIKAIVEIKLPGDRWRKGQKQDYEAIAGAKNKVVEMTDGDCTCVDPNDPPPIPIPIEAPEKKKDEVEEKQTDWGKWVVPGLAVVGVVALVVAAVAAAPFVAAAAAAVGAAALTAAAATAVFGLFSSPTGTPNEA
jgi:hypothetical protein